MTTLAEVLAEHAHCRSDEHEVAFWELYEAVTLAPDAARLREAGWEYAKTHTRGDAIGRAAAYEAGYRAALATEDRPEGETR